MTGDVAGFVAQAYGDAALGFVVTLVSGVFALAGMFLTGTLTDPLLDRPARK